MCAITGTIIAVQGPRSRVQPWGFLLSERQPPRPIAMTTTITRDTVIRVITAIMADPIMGVGLAGWGGGWRGHGGHFRDPVGHFRR
jgi:hypothetical protein